MNVTNLPFRLAHDVPADPVGASSHPSIMNADDPLPPILVADDNPTDVFFLRRRLAAAGIRNPLEHVEDGAEAIRWLEQRLIEPAPGALRPWLVFVDLKMPRVDGFEVLSWINGRGLAQQLTLVVLTTSDEPVDMERAKQLGAHRFLVKYPRPDDLGEIATDAFQRAFGPPGTRPDVPGSGALFPRSA